jgi:hypothetical protein
MITWMCLSRAFWAVGFTWPQGCIIILTRYSTSAELLKNIDSMICGLYVLSRYCLLSRTTAHLLLGLKTHFPSASATQRPAPYNRT